VKSIKGKTLECMRDRVILLLGFTGAFRSSELFSFEYREVILF
jgi:hypothetical protein